MKKNTKWMIGGGVATAIIIAAGLTAAADRHHGKNAHAEQGTKSHKGHHQIRFGKGQMTLETLQASLAERFKTLDTNNDGMVSSDEFSAQPIARFTSIDADGDGALTRSEMKQARKAHKKERRDKSSNDKSDSKATNNGKSDSNATDDASPKSDT